MLPKLKTSQVILDHFDIHEDYAEGSNIKSAASAGRSNTSGNFHLIPIYLPETYGGFGDVMNTLHLAEGLRQEFADKKIMVLFGSEAAYELVGKLYPHFRREQEWQRLKFSDANNHKGITVARTDKETAQSILERSLVAIRSPVPAHPSHFKELRLNAQYNFYIGEYDIDWFNLTDLKTNTLYHDRAGKAHAFLETGLGLDSFGVHINQSLVESEMIELSLEENRTKFSPDFSHQKKRELVERAGLARILKEVPDLCSRAFTMAYYHDVDYFRRRKNSFLSTLETELLTGNLKAGSNRAADNNAANNKAAVFDFSNCGSELSDYPFPPPYSTTTATGEYFFDKTIDESRRRIIARRFGSSWANECKSSEKGAETVTILQTGPVEHSLFLDFLRFSELPVAITGDASLAEAISLGKPFFYVAPRWKKYVISNLVSSLPDLLGDESLYLNAEGLPSTLRLIQALLATNSHFPEFRETEAAKSDAAKYLFSDLSTQRLFHHVNQRIIAEKNLSKNLAALIRKLI